MKRIPEGKRRALGRTVSLTKELLKRKSFEAARLHLEENMVGELVDSPDLFGVLGWLYSKQDGSQSRRLARDAFVRAHDLGSKKVDTYFHWVMMERQYTESTSRDARALDISAESASERITDGWKECERVCEIGIDRCGSNQLLCYWAGYASCRLAKVQENSGNFAHAEGVYFRSIEWYKKALTGREEDVSPVKKGSIWRGMTFAFDGLGDEERLKGTLLEWYSLAGSDGYFDAVCGRLIRKYEMLQKVPEFRYLLVLLPV